MQKCAVSQLLNFPVSPFLILSFSSCDLSLLCLRAICCSDALAGRWSSFSGSICCSEWEAKDLKAKEMKPAVLEHVFLKTALFGGYFLLSHLERVYCPGQHKLPKGNDPLIFLMLALVSCQPFSGSGFFPKTFYKWCGWLQTLWWFSLSHLFSNILPAVTPAIRVVIVPEAPRARWWFSILLALGEKRIPRKAYYLPETRNQSALNWKAELFFLTV